MRFSVVSHVQVMDDVHVHALLSDMCLADGRQCLDTVALPKSEGLLIIRSLPTCFAVITDAQNGSCAVHGHEHVA